MAKQKAPPGVAQMSEKEFSELLAKRNPKASTLNNVLEKMAAQNASIKASSPQFIGVKSPSSMSQESKAQVIEKNAAKQEQSRILKQNESNNEKVLKANDEIIKGDKKLIDVEKKLTSTLEKLVSALQKSSGLGTGPVTPSARAQELADSRKLDYRTFGQRIKDKIYGVGGNKFDANSLRYKFGTLKGLAETTGLIKRGSGSALESKLAIREEEMQTAESVAKLRGEDTEKGKAYYLGKAKESTAAKRELQEAEEKIKIHREAGLSDEEIQATREGKKLFQARDLAASKVISSDPKMKSEKAGLLGTRNQSIRFAGPGSSSESIFSPDTTEKESETGRVIGEQTDLLRKIEKNTRGGKLGLGEDGNKKEGVLSGLMDTLGNLAMFSAGGRMLRGAGAGLAKGAGKLGGVARGAAGGAAKGLGGIGKFAAKNAGKLKVGGGVLAGGLAAYEGYSDYQDASAAEQAGEITSSEADIKKTGAVTGAAGGLGGAAAGAIAGSAFGPVGTVVGGAVGGLAGSKIGKGIGEWGAKTWKGLTGKDDKSQPMRMGNFDNDQDDLSGPDPTPEQLKAFKEQKQKDIASGKIQLHMNADSGFSEDEIYSTMWKAEENKKRRAARKAGANNASKPELKIFGKTIDEWSGKKKPAGQASKDGTITESYRTNLKNVSQDEVEKHPNYKKYLADAKRMGDTDDEAADYATELVYGDMAKGTGVSMSAAGAISGDPTQHPNYKKYVDEELKLAGNSRFGQDAAYDKAKMRVKADMVSGNNIPTTTSNAPKKEAKKPELKIFGKTIDEWTKKKKLAETPKSAKPSRSDMLKDKALDDLADQEAQELISAARDSGALSDPGKVKQVYPARSAEMQSADKVAQASAQNDSMKYTTNKQGDQTLVNAPTNINKVTQTSVTKRPARSPDWYENRHRYKGMVPNVSF